MKIMVSKLPLRTAPFRSDDRGNIAPIAALVVIPILSIAGFAIDLQMTTTKKNDVQLIIDSAVIAGSKGLQAGRTRTQVIADMNAYVDALLDDAGGGLTCGTVGITYVDGTQDINATISCSQETAMSGIFGQEEMDFFVDSGSTYGIGKVEVSFIFDVSGSMAQNNRMENLRDSAHIAVDELLGNLSASSEPDDMRIAMASFHNRVNAGTYFQALTNVTPTRTYTATDRYRDSSNRNRTRTVTKTITSTCINERNGAEVFTDADPGPGAWFQAPAATFDDSSARNQDNSWSTPSCPDDLPVPLTTDSNKLHDFIDGLNHGGGTAGHMGVAWGWYLLSPNWTSIWPSASQPLPYDEPDAAKALIMMSDGEFLNVNNSGYGNSTQQARALCDEIKEQGVVIYTVAFEAPQAGIEVLEYCATSSAHAFNPTGAEELTDSYTAIANSISDLRITY
jgi:Flp pilus assembly protein TadG